MSTSEKNKNNISSKPGMRFQSIHWRLLIGFVLITLLSAFGMTAISILIEYKNVELLVFDRLESVSSQRQHELEYWIESVHNEMVYSLNENYALDRAQIILRLANENVYYDTYLESAKVRLQRAITQSTNQVIAYAYVDMQGSIVLSTEETLEGKDLSIPLDAFSVQFPFIEQEILGNCIMIVLPVIDWDDQQVGALVAFASIHIVDAILENPTNLGEGGKAYLVNANSIFIAPESLLADGRELTGGVINSEGIINLLSTKQIGKGKYRDFNGDAVLGVYRWLPQYQIGLLVEQVQSEAFQVITLILRSNIFVAFLTVLFAVGVSLFITHSISKPLTELVQTATKITSGDLTQTVDVGRMDEIGVLADAFNKMTAQIRELINTLEQRVSQRTQELQQRALQLETSAEVSRGVSSILNIDELLNRVVELIRESFNYSHVSIFLLDELTHSLTLRASSGNVQAHFRVFDLESEDLNAAAIREGRSILANEIHSNDQAQLDPLMPSVGVQLVIPLQMGSKFIGTLDVHHSPNGMFGVDEIKLIESLGDQIAIAIENARHYKQSQQLAVLEERNRLARDLHDSVIQSLYSMGLIIEGWRQLLADGEAVNINDYLDRVAEINQQAQKEMRLLISELRPPELEKMGLLRALNHRLESVEKRAGISARVLADQIVKLPAQIEKELYLISIEALNNALRHSMAQMVRLNLKKEQFGFYLEIMDDGKGFNLDEAGESGGMGLISMRERADKIGAELEVITSPGTGTIIRVRIPEWRNGKESIERRQSA